MGQQLRAFAHQVHAAAKQVPGGSHFWRIDIGHRQHPAAQQHSDLVRIDPVVLGFAAVDRIAFMYSACPRTKGMFCLLQRSASQYQVKMHSTARPRPPPWWKFVCSVSMSENFLL